MLNKYSKKSNDCKTVHNLYPRFLLLDSTQDVVYIWRYTLHQSGFDFSIQYQRHFSRRNLSVCAKIGTIILFLVKFVWKNQTSIFCEVHFLNAGRYSELLRAGRFRDRIPLRARFTTPAQKGPGVHPASYTMGTVSFPGVKRQGRGVDSPPHLSPRLKKE